MNRFIIFVVILLISISTAIHAQGPKPGGRGRPIEKIEQLERAKLIEILDLKEDAAVRFFARRKEFRNAQHDLFEQREKLFDNIDKRIRDNSELNDKECKDLLDDLMKIDSKIAAGRSNFYSSLSDILTPEQILKLAVFDVRFMREIRDLLTGRRKGNQG